MASSFRDPNLWSLPTPQDNHLTPVCQRNFTPGMKITLFSEKITKPGQDIGFPLLFFHSSVSRVWRAISSLFPAVRFAQKKLLPG
jgi:hypothetical protein